MGLFMDTEFDELDDLKLNSEVDDEDDEEIDDDEEEDEDESISFEKYAELSAKLDPFESDKSAQEKILQNEGYKMEDWDFYKNVWDVEILTDPGKTAKFAEIYAKFSK